MLVARFDAFIPVDRTRDPAKLIPCGLPSSIADYNKRFTNKVLMFRVELAGAEGLEPSRTVLETAMLPLHHAPRHKCLHIIASHYADVNSRVK